MICFNMFDQFIQIYLIIILLGNKIELYTGCKSNIIFFTCPLTVYITNNYEFIG